jgi:hypothetical protein
VQVGGAHWLSENQPTVVNVAAAVEGAGRTEGSIVCKATYTGAAGLRCGKTWVGMGCLAHGPRVATHLSCLFVLYTARYSSKERGIRKRKTAVLPHLLGLYKVPAPMHCWMHQAA